MLVKDMNQAVEGETSKKKYIIKASYKDCSIEDRRKFHQSTCILPISVGQNVHEGEKLKATLLLINRTFEKATILIDDTIQRYTIAIATGNLAKEEYASALFHGDLWLERNISIIMHILNIPYEILRWNDFSQKSNYSDMKNNIDDKLIRDKSYKAEIDINIKEFLFRYSENKRQLSGNEYDRAYNLCLEYLKEECTCMCLWAENGYNYEVYPTGRNRAMKATYEKFIKPNNPNLLKSVSIRFKKYFLNEQKLGDSVEIVC